jgi:hypothetical protein
MRISVPAKQKSFSLHRIHGKVAPVLLLAILLLWDFEQNFLALLPDEGMYKVRRSHSPLSGQGKATKNGHNIVAIALFRLPKVQAKGAEPCRFYPL